MIWVDSILNIMLNFVKLVLKNILKLKEGYFSERLNEQWNYRKKYGPSIKLK